MNTSNCDGYIKVVFDRWGRRALRIEYFEKGKTFPTTVLDVPRYLATPQRRGEQSPQMAYRLINEYFKFWWFKQQFHHATRRQKISWIWRWFTKSLRRKSWRHGLPSLYLLDINPLPIKTINEVFVNFRYKVENVY